MFGDDLTLDKPAETTKKPSVLDDDDLFGENENKAPAKPTETKKEEPKKEAKTVKKIDLDDDLFGENETPKPTQAIAETAKPIAKEQVKETKKTTSAKVDDFLGGDDEFTSKPKKRRQFKI